MAMIRITDSKGVVGKSGLFTLTSSTPGSIVVVHPSANEVLTGGMQNYQIQWSGSNIASAKTFEYSLDGGATWNYIGVYTGELFTYGWPNVPNVATTTALLRITDANHVSGTSQMFTITSTQGVGSINSLALSGLNNAMNIGNAQPLGISWTFTPDIGTSVEVEYSFDNGFTWVHIATVPTTENASTVWMTPATGHYNAVYIRVTSTKGMTRTSGAFSIGSNASVASRTAGYSLSNYPNPTNGITTIAFELRTPGTVTVSVTNSLGIEVAQLGPQEFGAGMNTMPLNISGLPDGVYHYTLNAGAVILGGKMIVVK